MGFVAPVVFFSLEFGPSGPLTNATDGPSPKATCIVQNLM